MNLTRKEPVTIVTCITCGKEIKLGTLDSVTFSWGKQFHCANCQVLWNKAKELMDTSNKLLSANLQQDEDAKDAFESEQHFYGK